MFVESKVFILRKTEVMFWRGEVFLNRRVRGKEKERRERGKDRSK